LEKLTIAIDGFSSCGKSTIAKALAAELGYNYVDTGAMYRAVTLYCMEQGWIKDHQIDKEKLLKYLSKIHIKFKFNPETKRSETYLNDRNVEREIRSMEISEQVSKVSAIKEVRQKLVKLQQEMGKGKGVVMDGRDIGTAVFPNAELKIFMTADIDVRVYRRYDELTAKGEKVTFSEVKENLALRDFDDTNRKDNPLRKADDAIVLDNSDLNKQQQLDFVIKIIKDYHLLNPGQ
jgi:cytidylate kinase